MMRLVGLRGVDNVRPHQLSGGLRPAVVAGMRERVNDLIWAVKIARGQANMATVEDARPAAALFGHLFPDMVR